MEEMVNCPKCNKRFNIHLIHKCEEDLINKPNHYHAGGTDVVSFCNGKVSKEQMKGFYRVNVLKYVSRYELKNGIEDLKKAKWNLEKLIELEEEN
ncbi:nucleotide kinase [Bacillus phage Harambe]|uniref:Uncharacterized protein n=1 Tax=Bacillus phage Harambe TaxID=1981931 RepID=A0A1W6JSF8_9CAUD|nr:nucleotide kinase [Bacillus phage Harambe]ARM70155.1 hypothetical protein HARAMBE_6 [Bacillus phage Harambe]